MFAAGIFVGVLLWMAISGIGDRLSEKRAVARKKEDDWWEKWFKLDETVRHLEIRVRKLESIGKKRTK